MVFNSLDFILFFTVFFILYWFVFNKKLKLQNLLILTGSYFFYAWWDWRFLSLLIASSIINFLIGIKIKNAKTDKNKNILLWTGLFFGLIGLFYFKYFNFFIESFIDLFALFNIHLNIHTVKLILPLGISFYTFRTISYILDVYYEDIEPTKDIVIFFSYVAFFPTLLSGPIDKARDFIHQLEHKRKFNYDQAADGLWQILTGLFKKIVIADNLASVTNVVFDNYQNYSGSVLFIGMFFYAIQLYADFSGYTDMAIGVGKLLGFNVTKNFNFPFFAQNIADFWRRWHISLTTWLTEYVYTPLSFTLRRYHKWGVILAIIITFIFIGLWHGANWKFVFYGFLHGLFFIPLILRGTMNKDKNPAKNRILPTFREFTNIMGTFILVMFSFILIRIDSIHSAINYYNSLLSKSLFTIPKLTGIENTNMLIGLLLIIVFMLIEWVNRNNNYSFEKAKNLNLFYQSCIILGLTTLMFFLGGTQQDFIYFQF